MHSPYIHIHICTYTHMQAHRATKTEKGRERYQPKSNIPLRLLLFLGNFHVNGKIENVNKSLFFKPEGRFYLYPQIPVYSMRAVN